MVKAIDVELNQREVECRDAKLEARLMVSKKPIPRDVHRYEIDSIIKGSVLEKEGKLPSVVLVDWFAEPDHCFSCSACLLMVYLLAPTWNCPQYKQP